MANSRNVLLYIVVAPAGESAQLDKAEGVKA